MTEKLANLNLPRLKTIDTAIQNYVKDLGITAYTNKGQKQVPVVWVGAERSFQVKNNMFLRDSNGVLILPQITVARTALGKGLEWKGTYYGIGPEEKDAKGGFLTISRRLSGDKNSEFKRADSIDKTAGKINFKLKTPSEKEVYEHLSIPTPVYVDIKYEITIRTEYQMQMNEILETFLFVTGGSKSFVAKSDGHKYECFYDESYGLENNTSNFDKSERIFKTTLPIRTLGYIIGDGSNQIKRKKVIRENAVSIGLGLEEQTIGGREDYYGPINPDTNGFKWYFVEDSYSGYKDGSPNGNYYNLRGFNIPAYSGETNFEYIEISAYEDNVTLVEGQSYDILSHGSDFSVTFKSVTNDTLSTANYNWVALGGFVRLDEIPTTFPGYMKGKFINCRFQKWEADLSAPVAPAEYLELPNMEFSGTLSNQT